MADKEDKTSLSLSDGHYKVTGNWYRSIFVEGESIVLNGQSLGDLPILVKFGDFGEADPAICQTTGQSCYNIQLSYRYEEHQLTELGVISKDGVKITAKNMMGVGVFEWMTEKEAAEWENDGDPIEAPPAPYKIQPENQGHLLWLTGPPGLGKSTSAQLLARNHGYVYYEGDCFGGFKNPYIPVDVEDPSLAQVNQRPLKGEGLERRKEALGKFMKEFNSFRKGDYDKAVFKEYYGLMCDDIKRERGRIGGDWAIAAAIMTRDLRDLIRSKLGPDLVFVVLNMELEDQVERIRKRHQGDERVVKSMKELYALCDPTGKDEENVLDVKVTPDMSPEDVTKKIIDMLIM